MHYGASGARNVDALFSCTVESGAVSTKSVSGHVT
jgi:hypothetical protein